jgi:hypothetical protein
MPSAKIASDTAPQWMGSLLIPSRWLATEPFRAAQDARGDGSWGDEPRDKRIMTCDSR